MRGILLLPVLGIAALVVAALDENAGVRRWWHLRGELADARARIERLTGEVEGLRADASQLESDPFAMERAIRALRSDRHLPPPEAGTTPDRALSSLSPSPSPSSPSSLSSPRSQPGSKHGAAGELAADVVAPDMGGAILRL